MRRTATGTEMAMATLAFQLRPPLLFSSGEEGVVVLASSVADGDGKVRGVVREKTWDGLIGR